MSSLLFLQKTPRRGLETGHVVSWDDGRGPCSKAEEAVPTALYPVRAWLWFGDHRSLLSLSSSATSTSPPHHPSPSSTPPRILVAAAPPLAQRGRRQQRQLRDVLELRLEAFDTGSKIKAYPIRRLDEGSWWHVLKFRSSENMLWSYHMFWTSENSIPWCVTSTVLCRGCHSSGVSYLMSYPLSFLAYLSYC
jgi:hypothetical protein